MTERAYPHARYDEIRDGYGNYPFEAGQEYTPSQVNEARFCAHLRTQGEEGTDTAFGCIYPLRYDGDRLCKSHFDAWVVKKEAANKIRAEKEAEREQRRQEWFERECEKEYNHIWKTGSVTFSEHVKTDEEKEAVVWKMAQMMVRSRDKYAPRQQEQPQEEQKEGQQ